MKNIMFIAPPAAGKGTQAKLIAKKYQIPHISTGNILREIAKEDSELGNYVFETLASGKLVKDEITYQLIENRLKKEDCQNGYTIDGFPRNMEQAIEYEKILNKLGYSIGEVILINIAEKTLEKRITGRRICENCNTIFNINEIDSSPKKESICDVCGGKLYQRNDDNEESFEIRYQEYLDKTSALITYYQNQKILYRIQSDKSKEEVFQELCERIEKEMRK